MYLLWIRNAIEQADIEATFNPVDYKDDGFVDITDWFNREDLDQ